MARRKVAMRLIEKAGPRATTHAKRARGLQKKASELSTLCGVPVALVCAGAGAAATPLVWESEEGVLERYRRAVPPEARAAHTHRSYLETELGKERAKLARARHGCPGGLADWDAALNDMTLNEARELLDTIDVALRATKDRMEALGLPADGGHGALDEQIAPGSSDDAVMPQQLGHGGGGNPVDMDAHDGLLDQFSWDDPFQMQPEPGCGGFQNLGGNYSGAGDEMLAPAFANSDDNYSGGGDEMLGLGFPNADYNYSGGGDMLALSFPNSDYNYSGGGGGGDMLALGFPNADYNYSGGGGGDEMLAPGFGNADFDWPDLTMWHAGESCYAVMPHGYYPDFAGGSLAPEHYSGEVVTGGEYVNTQPSGYGYPMGMGMGKGVGDNFTNLESNYTAAHWQAQEFQRFDATSTGERLSDASSPHYLY